MKFFSSINPTTEFFTVNIGIDDVKNILHEKENVFYLKWQSEVAFSISLNFSLGSDLLFDTNYPNTKSDIIFKGNLIKINGSKTKIVLEPKRNYWLLMLLITPVLMLILELIMNLGIPVAFYFIFPFILSVVLIIIISENKRLIKKFEEYLHQKINLNE